MGHWQFWKMYLLLNTRINVVIFDTIEISKCLIVVMEYYCNQKYVTCIYYKINCWNLFAADSISRNKKACIIQTYRRIVIQVHTKRSFGFDHNKVLIIEKIARFNLYRVYIALALFNFCLQFSLILRLWKERDHFIHAGKLYPKI